VREEPLVAAVSRFFTERILGPKRLELLAAELGAVDNTQEQAWQARSKALERAVGEIEAPQARLMRTLEAEDDPGGAVFSRVRERLAELERERRVKLEEIDGLEASPPSARSPATALLEGLPVVEAELTLVPESVLRPLFDAFRLEVRYSRPSNHCTLRVTISDDSLDSLVAAIEQVIKRGGHRTGHKRRPGGRRSTTIRFPCCPCPRGEPDQTCERQCASLAGSQWVSRRSDRSGSSSQYTVSRSSLRFCPRLAMGPFHTTGVATITGIRPRIHPGVRGSVLPRCRHDRGRALASPSVGTASVVPVLPFGGRDPAGH
jgi:hypothetical protein